MYPAALPGVLGLQSLLCDQGSFPAAEAFAARILTLPTHRHVGFEDIVKLLIENKATLEKTDLNGFTALHYATQENQKEIQEEDTTSIQSHQKDCTGF